MCVCVCVYRDIIPEESSHAACGSYDHHHTKSLCEPSKDDGEWTDEMILEDTDDTHMSMSAASEKLLRSGREPLLPKLTPRAQIRRSLGVPSTSNAAIVLTPSASVFRPSVGNLGPRRHQPQVTTALLSTTNNSDYDEDEDDFDMYDDDSLVVTTSMSPMHRIRYPLGNVEEFSLETISKRKRTPPTTTTTMTTTISMTTSTTTSSSAVITTTTATSSNTVSTATQFASDNDESVI